MEELGKNDINTRDNCMQLTNADTSPEKCCFQAFDATSKETEFVEGAN